MVKRKTDFQEMYLVDTFLFNKLMNEKTINNNNNLNTNTVSINNNQPELTQPTNTNKKINESSSSFSNLSNDIRSENGVENRCQECKDEVLSSNVEEETEGEIKHKFINKDPAFVVDPNSDFQKNIKPIQSINNSSAHKDIQTFKMPAHQSSFTLYDGPHQGFETNSSVSTFEDKIPSSQRPAHQTPFNFSNNAYNQFQTNNSASLNDVNMQKLKTTSQRTSIHPPILPYQNNQFKSLNAIKQPNSSKTSLTPITITLPMEEDDSSKMVQYNPQRQIEYNPEPTLSTSTEDHAMDTSLSVPIEPNQLYALNSEVNDTRKRKRMLQQKKERKKGRNTKDMTKEIKLNDMKKIEFKEKIKPRNTLNKQTETNLENQEELKSIGQNVGKSNDKKMIEHKFKSFYCSLCDPYTFFEKKSALERHMKNMHAAFQQKDKGTKRKNSDKDKANKKLKARHLMNPQRYLKYI